MKQTFAVVILVFVLFIIAYFFIPNNESIKCSIKMNAVAGSVQKAVSSNLFRPKWFPPEGIQISNNEYLLDDCRFKFVTDNLQNSAITIQYKNIVTSSYFTILPQIDFSVSSLNFNIKRNNNFTERISNYLNNKHIYNSIEKMFLSLQKFVSNSANVYGVEMKRGIVKDSTLISIKSDSKEYPTVKEIYKNIEILKQFAMSNGAKEVNPPMLNIFQNDNKTYSYMVALPVDKWLNGNNKIIPKRLLAGGNVLESGDVIGGFYSVDKALKELENFKIDNASVSPAIPFQSLITDRSKELDSAKWRTKLYYPIY